MLLSERLLHHLPDVLLLIADRLCRLTLHVLPLFLHYLLRRGETLQELLEVGVCSEGLLGCYFCCQLGDLVSDYR